MSAPALSSLPHSIVERSGVPVPFDPDKIRSAIARAGHAGAFESTG